MRNKVLIWVVLMGFFQKAYGYPSLFPYLKENNDHVNKYYLSAIIYSNQDQWSIILNNKTIRPENRDEIKSFSIEEVTPYEIKISWISDHSKIKKEIVLCPGEVFDLNK